MDLLLWAMTAFAMDSSCPDLRGAYLCRQNSYRVDTIYEFDQVVNGAFWEYRMTAQPDGEPAASRFDFVADGVERELIDQVSGQRLQAVAVCERGSLKVSGSTRLPSGQEIRFAEILSRTSGGDLSNRSLDIHGNWVSETCSRR